VASDESSSACNECFHGVGMVYVVYFSFDSSISGEMKHVRRNTDESKKNKIKKKR
jgi:hypothetical protein